MSDPFAQVFHDVGEFFKHPFQSVTHEIGAAIGEVGHAIGGFTADVVGGVSAGAKPLVQQVGNSATQIVSEGAAPLVRDIGAGVSSITSSLSLPLTIGAAVLAFMVFSNFFR